ncbi:cytochrome P450 [Marinovum sp.]|uniref:cytochrome P450 n=1 Tax=Marinovum sp. TaxID=2024839 RepID=UPI002B26D7DE|nr:cytochrome P450 [Marinovum sp.]
MTDLATCPHSVDWSEFRPFEHDGMTEFFARKREEEPVFFDQGTGYWIVTRRDDVRAIFADPDRFSAANVHDPLTAYPPELVAYLKEEGFRRDKTQANCDRPKHTRIRQVAQSFLNIRQFKTREPQIREMVEAAVNKLRGRGRVDLVDDFAYELPARVLFLLLGVPDIDARKIKVWADSRFDMISGDADFEAKMEAGRQVMDFWNYCGAIIADRQKNPGDDYPSHLLAAHARDPDAISLGEIQNLTFGVLLAGHETTTNAIGNTMHMLLRDREEWDRLVNEPTLAPAYVEEGLRAGPPVVIWRRVTTEEVKVGDVTLPEGAPIMMSLASANRDEAHFACPHDFEGTRANARDHVSFGYGIHFCMGAPLAKLELKLVLELLSQAFPNMTLVPDTDPHWQRTILVRGPGRLLVDLNE